MNQIIQKAIEGGWGRNTLKVSGYRKPSGMPMEVQLHLENDKSGYWETVSYYEIVCDSSFWQALGKACGWYEFLDHECKYAPKGGGNYFDRCDKCKERFDENKMSWKKNALRFHEINLTEGWDKAIKYLEELIK